MGMGDDVMSITGDRIKELRKGLGLRVDELADKVGVSRSTMFRYESGAIEKVPFDVIQQLADILGTSIAYLTGSSMLPGQLSILEIADDYKEQLKEFYEAKNSAQNKSEKRKQLEALINCATEDQLDLLIGIVRTVIKNRTP